MARNTSSSMGSSAVASSAAASSAAASSAAASFSTVELRHLDGQTDSAIYQQIGDYYHSGENAKAEALLAYLEDRKKSSKSVQKYADFSQKYKDVKVQLDGLENQLNSNLLTVDDYHQQRSALLFDFFKKDIGQYNRRVGRDFSELSKQKDQQIEQLQQQLSDIVLQKPTLKEYLSPKRRKLVTIQSKIQKMETDTKHYPKNVLIYLMGISESSIFGVRNKFKRGWVKMLWKWKSDDIKSGLKNFEEKIKVQPHDTQRTISLKQMLGQQLVKAKKAYVQNRASSVGLPS